MDRLEIHTQISVLLDRINFLNNKLAKEKNLHPVEIDLLQNYNMELNKLIEQLMNTSGDLSDELVQKIEDVTSKTEEAFQDKEQEVEEQPEAKQETKQAQPRENGTEEKSQTSQVTEKEQQTESKPVEPTQTQEEPVEKREEPIPMQSDLSSTKEEKSEPEAKTTSVVNGKQAEASEANDSIEEVSINDRFKKEESIELADKLKQGNNKNLKDLFELNERFTFINELFNGDSDHFNKALKDLERCSSLTEARSYLSENVESRYDWSEKESYANEFKSAILKKFESKIEL